MSSISTHVLDLAAGRPAAGIGVVLERQTGAGAWSELGHGSTDADGRLRQLVPDRTNLTNGIYRLRFATGAYFAGRNVRAFYPEVHVVFAIEADEHYHVPVLLSPYGYSTYRGS